MRMPSNDKEIVERAAIEARAERVDLDRSSTTPDIASRPGTDRQPKFGALVALCTPELTRVLRKALGTSQVGIEVDDLVQETWSCVAKRLPDYRSEANGFRAWLVTIALNQLRNTLRKAYGRGGGQTKSASDSQLVRDAMDTATSVFSRTSGYEQVKRWTNALRRCLPEMLRRNSDQVEVIAWRHFGTGARALVDALAAGGTLRELLSPQQTDFQQVAENMAAAGSEQRSEGACDQLYRRAMVCLGTCLLRHRDARNRVE
jgi:RNA polymerase sigma factor (sigma-70 family)